MWQTLANLWPFKIVRFYRSDIGRAITPIMEIAVTTNDTQGSWHINLWPGLGEYPFL